MHNTQHSHLFACVWKRLFVWFEKRHYCLLFPLHDHIKMNEVCANSISSTTVILSSYTIWQHRFFFVLFVVDVVSNSTTCIVLYVSVLKFFLAFDIFFDVVCVCKDKWNGSYKNYNSLKQSLRNGSFLDTSDKFNQIYVCTCDKDAKKIGGLNLRIKWRKSEEKRDNACIKCISFGCS